MRKNSLTKNLLVIIPAYNEERNIKMIINLVKREIPNADILVVDDGSTDRTSEIVKMTNVLVLSHKVNLGVGAAFRTGIKFALRRHYKYVIQIDADGQHDPKYAHLLLEKLKRGNLDIVIGSRFSGKRRTKWYPLVRYMGVIFYSALIRLITKYKIYDATSGYLAMNRRAMRAFVIFYPNRHPAIPSLIFAYLVKLKVAEVPISFKPRLYGKSMFTKARFIIYHFKVLFDILRAIHTVKKFRSKLIL